MSSERSGIRTAAVRITANGNSTPEKPIDLTVSARYWFESGIETAVETTSPSFAVVLTALAKVAAKNPGLRQFYLSLDTVET